MRSPTPASPCSRLALGLVLLGLSGPGCSDTEDIDPTPPVLSVPPLNLAGSYDPATKRQGDLYCLSDTPGSRQSDWCFIGGADGRHLYNYKGISTAEVRAVTAGTVTEVVSHTSDGFYPDDFLIHTKAVPNGAYEIEYDHVRNVRVKVGQVVQPGDVLGTVGGWNGDKSIGRTEVQINHYQSLKDLRLMRSECLKNYGTEDFNRLHAAAVSLQNSVYPGVPTSECESPDYH